MSSDFDIPIGQPTKRYLDGRPYIVTVSQDTLYRVRLTVERDPALWTPQMDEDHHISKVGVE